jgi:glycosyltransferase involved in cell wall biosynthesis
VSKEEIVKIFNISNESIQVIPHGILKYDINRSVIQKKAQEIISIYDLKDKFVLSMLGHQNRYKGTDLMVEAFKQIMKDNRDIVLLVFGKVENVDLILNCGYVNVIIRDEFISDLEFLATLHISDVLLLPYREISQSGVLLTAIAEKIPVMVSSVGGLNEPLKYGNIGWCIGQPTVDSLKSFLIYIKSHKENIKSIKKNQSEWDLVHKQYSWETIREKTYTLY